VHPYLLHLADRDSGLQSLVREAGNFYRRQDYPDFFLLNGAVYVAQTEWLQGSRTFLSNETVGFEMPEER
jgi:CMP-N,N'-diacetyllegionaminic acid synthase